MTKIGYTRVSTVDQTTERQELGDIKVFEDKASGKNMERPALQEMLAYIRKGDEVVLSQSFPEVDSTEFRQTLCG